MALGGLPSAFAHVEFGAGVDSLKLFFMIWIAISLILGAEVNKVLHDDFSATVRAREVSLVSSPVLAIALSS